MKPKIRKVLDQCLENGTSAGIYRWLKHQESVILTDSQIDQLADTICNYINTELDDWFEE